jgi:hypothetical protein
MDTALILKQKYGSGAIKDFKQASDLLHKSELVKRLLTDFDDDILGLVNRLIEFTEIPFASKIEKVQKWTNKLADMSFCNDGFSITGKSDDILSCYNSMITIILIRLDYSDKLRISKGIDWIIKYQNVERNLDNKWTGSRILKYGGCLKSTPCYIGIVKSMIALSDYKRCDYYKPNDLLENKLNKGLNYILNHQVYKRKSNGQPISQEIDKINYPFSYKTNIIEILRLLKDNKLDKDSRCNSAKDYLRAKKQASGFWYVNSAYRHKSWIQFDKPKESGLWVSNEISNIIN